MSVKRRHAHRHGRNSLKRLLMGTNQAKISRQQDLPTRCGIRRQAVETLAVPHIPIARRSANDSQRGFGHALLQLRYFRDDRSSFKTPCNRLRASSEQALPPLAFPGLRRSWQPPPQTLPGHAASNRWSFDNQLQFLAALKAFLRGRGGAG